MNKCMARPGEAKDSLPLMLVFFAGLTKFFAWNVNPEPGLEEKSWRRAVRKSCGQNDSQWWSKYWSTRLNMK